MPNLNSVQLAGHLGRDAELRYLPNGNAMLRFSIATTRKWKANDEWKAETTWLNVVYWGGEKLAEYLTKGKAVYLQGRISTRDYEKDGTKVYVTEIVADQITMLGVKPDSEGSTPPRASRKPDTVPASEGITDDDVPF